MSKVHHDQLFQVRFCLRTTNARRKPCLFSQGRRRARLMADKVRTILLMPHRTVKVGIAIEGEDGELQSYEGYRVQHNLRPRADEGRPALSPGDG